ncbi:hypothetical protein [Pseudopelagicola sp. nBUS_19]|uniref:hypothetical protein n=1 Tax=Pseudopelagicola sp. nBUS_19 TaxID=3395316 RepID=UPI003EBED232
MKFEAFSHPKARDLSVPADDVLLHIPGHMTGIFDGASDSLGRRVHGVPIGRLAAMAAAHSASALPVEAANWPARDILEILSCDVGAKVPMNTGDGPASTTAMIAFNTPDGIRMLGIGDTGFRINGGDAKITDLAPDRASIPGRVTLFELFLSRGLPPLDCEMLSREGIGKGLDWAVSSGILSHVEADKVLQRALDQLALPQADEEAIHLIRHGLQSQHQLANVADAQLGYGVLNGTSPAMKYAVDEVIPYGGLVSVEIFSDGYLSPPPTVSIAAWENVHASLEQNDPHKIKIFPAVKGSSTTAFFDDRTVAIIQYQSAG